MQKRIAAALHTASISPSAGLNINRDQIDSVPIFKCLCQIDGPQSYDTNLCGIEIPKLANNPRSLQTGNFHLPSDFCILKYEPCSTIRADVQCDVTDTTCQVYILLPLDIYVREHQHVASLPIPNIPPLVQIAQVGSPFLNLRSRRMELDGVHLSVEFYCSHRMNLEDMRVLARIKTGAVKGAPQKAADRDLVADRLIEAQPR